MVATFCLRLAAGLLAALVVLDPTPIPPRFFRVQHLAALGLLAVAGLFTHDLIGTSEGMLFAAGIVIASIGSIVWHVDEAPGGPVINWLGAGAVLALLGITTAFRSETTPTIRILDDLASAFVLGSATSAMLMGHSYLIAPTMTMTPLLRLLGLLGVALMFRIALACYGLWQWTSGSASVNLETETLVWLGARWLVGFLVPLVLGWLAWETARIRSTQSATGILYVVTVLVFLGELTSMLLVEKTGCLL